MSHARKNAAQNVARRTRNVSLVIGALMALFGAEGLLGAIHDLRAGDLMSGTAAASRQPYGPFLRPFCFSILLVLAVRFFHDGLRTRPEAERSPDDKQAW